MRIYHHRGLTEREIMLAYHVYKGRNNLEISMAMGNGRGTVRGNLRNVYTKLGFFGDEARVKLATWFAKQVMRSQMIEQGYSYLIGDLVFEKEDSENFLS